MPMSWLEKLGIDSYQAAEVAAKLRQELVNQGESFVFETGVLRSGGRH